MLEEKGLNFHAQSCSVMTAASRRQAVIAGTVFDDTKRAKVPCQLLLNSIFKYFKTIFRVAFRPALAVKFVQGYKHFLLVIPAITALCFNPTNIPV